MAEGQASVCVGRNIEDFFPPAPRIFLQTHVWPLVLREGGVKEVYLEFGDAAHRPTPVLLNCRKGELSGAPRYFWTLLEARNRSLFEAALLAARKRAEETSALLTKSEERYALAALETNDGMFEIDLVARSVTISARYALLLGGKPLRECTLSDFLADIHVDDRAAFMQALESTADGFRITYRTHTEAGGTRWLDARTHAGRDGDGIGNTVLGTVRDITESVRLERLKSEFVSTVSHELRTPLTSIRGSLSLLAGNVLGEVTEPVAAMIDIASRNTSRLLRIVDDLLDFQKLEAGAFELDRVDVDVCSVASDAVEANRGFAQQFGVKLEFERPIHPLNAHVDVERLMQVLANLISNAVKFSPSGSTTRVVVGSSGGRILLEVTDQGRGVPKEFRSRLFSQFAQAEAADSAAKGTGLGLSICRSMVELMGGEIGYTPTPSGGSTFSVWLPAVVSRDDPGSSRAP